MADEGNQTSGDAWGDDISDERKSELEQRLQAWQAEANHGERKGPYDIMRPDHIMGLGGPLVWYNAMGLPDEERWRLSLTGADVFWLAARALAGTTKEKAVAESMWQLRLPKDAPTVLAKPRLDGLHLEGADLSSASLENAYLSRAHLEGAYLSRASLEGADLSEVHLEKAYLWEASLEGADLSGAHLEGADLSRAHLEGAYLNSSSLEKADLSGAHLEGADMTRAMLDSRTDLSGVVLADTSHWYGAFLRRLRRERVYGVVSLGDIHWNDADLTLTDWSGLCWLGDERSMRWWRRTRYESERATRANTQLAKRLRDAGMNDDADRFAYRAQVRQRGVHLLRLRFGPWLFSWLLFVIAGYGYRPLRTLFWYLAVIFGFAFLYMHFGHINGKPFEFDEALVFSVTSFHGRGFFPGTLDLKDLVTKLAASEAVFGLFIEVSFIATFTQRYFGK